MGSELYAYFDIKGTQEVHSEQLDELAADAGMDDVPGGGASHVVARLDARSAGRARQARSRSSSTPPRSSSSTPTAGARYTTTQGDQPLRPTPIIRTLRRAGAAAAQAAAASRIALRLANSARAR